MSIEVYKYQGFNETINRLTNENEQIWIVNGRNGRQVIVLEKDSSRDQAVAKYKELYENGNARYTSK